MRRNNSNPYGGINAHRGVPLAHWMGFSSATSSPSSHSRNSPENPIRAEPDSSKCVRTGRQRTERDGTVALGSYTIVMHSDRAGQDGTVSERAPAEMARTNED